MSKRPTYGGVPAAAEAAIAARRRVEASVVQPPPAPPPSIPLSVEQRLKALERKVDVIGEKLDTVLEVLTHGEKPGADLFGHPPKPKRFKASP